MKKLYIILSIVGLLACTSCKDFLDVKPTNQADASQSITSPRDAKVMLNGLYNAMTTSSFYGRNFILYGDAKGGDLTIQSNGRGYDYMFAYKHYANSYSMSGFWSTGYNMIMLCNNIIECIDAIPAEDPDKASGEYDSYYGQAMTIRAMIHYDLCRLYGKCYNDNKASYGVPVVLKSLTADAQPLRESVENVYKAVIEDLDKAAGYLEDDTDAKVGYMNYYTNRAIKARVCMDMENWSEALALADMIIDSNEYKLYDQTNWADSWAKQGGSESIFELAMCVNEGDLGTTSCIGAQYVLGGGNGRNNQIFMASHYWIDLMGDYAAGNDVRWDVMGIDQIDEDNIAAAKPGEEVKLRMGSCWKYLGGLAGSGDGKASSSAVNVKLIRLSEMYFIAAEAALMNGDKKTAALYLNEIANNRYKINVPDISEANITRQMILDEKDKEFLGEGLRFWDLIRTNSTIYMDDETPDVKVTDRESVLDRSFYKCILPIDKDEINANPGLGTQQNPGY